jgi:hypothetical protein
MIPGERRAWLPLAAGLSLLVAGVWGMLVLPRREIPSSHRPSDPLSVTDPDIPQATWEARVFPAGVLGKPSKTQKELVKRERSEVVAAVTDVYEALILAPGSLDDLSGTALSPAAAKALRSSRLVLPDGMKDVATTKRTARIGIQVEGGRRAAAKVAVWYSGRIKEKPVKVLQRSTLWLEAAGKRWLVIAFDGTQGRVR